MDYMVAPLSSILFEKCWQGFHTAFHGIPGVEANVILDSRSSKLSKDKRVGMETGY